VQFILRSVLEKQTIDEAENFIRSVRHASGQNYIVSAAGDIRCFECCGTSVVRYAPDDYRGRIFHSNHPLVNTDHSENFPESREKKNRNSSARLKSISDRLGDTSRLMTIEDIKAALSAHDDPDNPVSRRINPDNIGNSIGYTAGSSIYELAGKPRLHLASGPPCETEFKIFDFKGVN
jgi:hypothetical protein